MKLSAVAALAAAVLVWTHAHPALVAMAVLFAVSALHDNLAKFPRLQALAKLAAGLGFDAPKVVAAVLQILTGSPSVSPNVAAIVKVVPPAAFLCVFLWGCGLTPPAIDARALARGAVETSAEAWMVAAQACETDVEEGRNDTALQAKCVGALGPARSALIAAASAIDAAESDGGGAPLTEVACDLQVVSAALDEVTSFGVALPPSVSDAQKLVAALSCPVQQDAGKDGAP